MQRENDRIKINYALIRKNKAHKALKKAEDAIMDKISIKIARSEKQCSDRRKKRLNKNGKLSNIKINPKHENTKD
jgi:hypothetical protein